MLNVIAAVMSPKSASGAATRARIFVFLRAFLVVCACLHFVLVAASGFTYARSVAFAFAAIPALWLILGAIFSDNEPIPLPDPWLWVTLLAWAGWSAASYFWSLHPAYSRAEIGTEIGWGLCIVAIYYVAARTGASFRALAATAVTVALFLGLLAIEPVFTQAAQVDFAAENPLPRIHGGQGAFSTFVVLVMPVAPLLLAPPPMGYGAGKRSLGALALVGVVLLATAWITENRMIWLAFAVGLAVFAALASWRWRAALKRAPWRWAAALVVLFALVGALFVNAVIQRAKFVHGEDRPVAQVIAEDPRLVLWQHTFEYIGERPWTGFGFGKSILRAELQDELGDPMLVHAHNLFVSQWVQTGAIGAALLVALLLAIAWRYATFLRSRDDLLAAVGLAGLVMLATFVVKNLTDDFLVRPTSKEFWALTALFIGYGIRRERAGPQASTTPGERSAAGRA